MITRASLGKNASGHLLVLLVALPIYGWVAALNKSIIGFSDSMDYLLIADFYAGLFGGAGSPLASAFYAQSRFPPLLPLLLATFGAGSTSQHAAAIVSSATAVLACVCVSWWAARASGSRAAGALVGIALAVSPSFFLLALYPVSEPLSIALICLVFGLVASPTLTRKRILLAAGIVALLPLLRAATLPMIPALALFLMFQQASLKRGEKVLVSLSAMVPATLWHLYRTQLGAETYAQSLSPMVALERLGGIPDIFWLQPLRLFEAIYESWRVESSSVVIVLTAVLAVLAISGLVRALLAKRMDAFFFGGYVAMILVWPYPDELGRLFLLIYPLFILYCYSGIKLLVASTRLRSTSGKSLCVAMLASIILILSGNTILKFAQRASLPIDAEVAQHKREALFFIADTDRNAGLIAREYAAILRMSKELGQYIPQGECVFMTPPQLAMLNSSVIATVYPAGLGESRSGADVLTDCNYFVLSVVPSRQSNFPPFYPWQSLQGWTEILLGYEIEVDDDEKALAVELLRRNPQPPHVENTNSAVNHEYY